MRDITETEGYSVYKLISDKLEEFPDLNDSFDEYIKLLRFKEWDEGYTVGFVDGYKRAIRDISDTLKEMKTHAKDIANVKLIL